jgi:HTH-type transcriptional regulator, cell division transcriptional repressor
MERKWQLFSERLMARRNHLGLTQGELANKTGVHLRSVTNWESGDFAPRGEKMRKLAEVLSTTVAHLLGEDNAYPNNNISAQEIKQSPATRKVPVVSFARAGEGGNFHDMMEQIAEFTETESRDPNCYALIIEGDSMLPEFKPGDRVTFEPNRESQNGDVVVARLGDTGHVYFKLFHRIGAKGDVIRLTSLNPIYPPLEFPATAFRFIHPMLELKRKWRR